MNAITRAEAALVQGPTVEFELNGRKVAAHAGETLLQVADREGVAIPRLCYKEGFDLAGNCRTCMVEIAGERVLAPSCCRAPAAGMKVSTDSERVLKSQKLVLELLLSDVGESDYTLHSELTAWANELAVGKPRFPVRAPVEADLSHPAMTVRLDACIQCTRCVRACRNEQVNDVIGMAFRGQGVQGRVRHGRPDGRLDLRRLRRVRAGLPDRRADAGARRRADGPRQEGRVALSLLRRRLPDHLQRQGRPHPLRRGPRRPRQPRAALRQGPLRLRLRPPSAPADEAADPPRRRAAQARRLRDGSGTGDGRVPRGDLGGGARLRRRHAAQDPRARRPRGARRLRLGEGQQRRGLPVPEAGPHRLRQQQRRPLHAPVPRLLGGGPARGHRLGGGVEPGDGRDEGGGGDPHRRQSDGEPSGGGDLDEERGQGRHQADRLRPAALRPGARRPPLPAVQAGHRRGAAERDDARHRRARASSTRPSSPAGPSATRSCARTSRATRPS